MKNFDKVKKKMKESYLEIINDIDNIDEENYKMVEKITKNRERNKEKLKKLAERYCGLSSVCVNQGDLFLKSYRRLGYYEIIKDCIELLQENDENIKLGFGFSTDKKEEQE